MTGLEMPVGTCQVQVDNQSPESWGDVLQQFADASIYQTLECGAARWGKAQLSTLVVSRDGIPVAAALVRQIRLPMGLGGIAYAGWGPAWTRRNNGADLEALRCGIRALRKEYAGRRKLFLKVTPNLYVAGDHPAKRLFKEEGFDWCARDDRTILVDLSPSLEDLRARMRRRWRQTLAKAEKQNLEIVEGTGVDLYDEGLKVYEQMHVRKQFAEFVDKTRFRAMQESLPEKLKMRILLVRESGETVAAIAWSVIGNTGLPLLAATGPRALKNNAAYLMWWKMVEWLKLNGFAFCDLGGIDPEQNPGGFTFKSGIAGEPATEVKLLGEFNYCEHHFSRLLVTGGFGTRDLVRRARLRWEKIRRPQSGRVAAGES
jgi:lipid II:glycine glycyltransferase (peptidoglycan interpeptide bridge formation enzyme)